MPEQPWEGGRPLETGPHQGREGSWGSSSCLAAAQTCILEDCWRSVPSSPVQACASSRGTRQHGVSPVPKVERRGSQQSWTMKEAASVGGGLLRA